MQSTTQGFGLPSMTTANVNAIVGPIAGLHVYDNEEKLDKYYDGTAWHRFLVETPQLNLAVGDNSVFKYNPTATYTNNGETATLLDIGGVFSNGSSFSGDSIALRIRNGAVVLKNIQT